MNTEKKIKQDWRDGAYRRLRTPKLSRSKFNTILDEIIGIHIDALLEIKDIEIAILKDSHSRLKNEKSNLAANGKLERADRDRLLELQHYGIFKADNHNNDGYPIELLTRPYFYRIVNRYGNIVIHGKEIPTNSKMNTILELCSQKDGEITYREIGISDNYEKPLSLYIQAKMYQHRLLKTAIEDRPVSLLRSLWLVLRGHRVRISETIPTNPLPNQPNTTERASNALNLVRRSVQEDLLCAQTKSPQSNSQGKQ